MIAFTRNEFCLKKLKPDYQELAKREIFGFFVTSGKNLQISQGNRGCKNQSVRKIAKKVTLLHLQE